jgi:predicted acylesterase/phospholipase RssA
VDRLLPVKALGDHLAADAADDGLLEVEEGVVAELCGNWESATAVARSADAPDGGYPGVDAAIKIFTWKLAGVLRDSRTGVAAGERRETFEKYTRLFSDEVSALVNLHDGGEMHLAIDGALKRRLLFCLCDLKGIGASIETDAVRAFSEHWAEDTVRAKTSRGTVSYPVDTDGARKFFKWQLANVVTDRYVRIDPMKQFETFKRFYADFDARLLTLERSFRRSSLDAYDPAMMSPRMCPVDLRRLSADARPENGWTSAMCHLAVDGIMTHTLHLCRYEHAEFTITDDKKFNRLVLAGGGGKGAAYPAAIRTLLVENPWMFSGDLKIAGSSAGGLAATAIAFRFGDLMAFLTEVQSTSTAIFVESGFSTRYPSLAISRRSGVFSATGVVSLIDYAIARKVKEFLFTAVKEPVGVSLGARCRAARSQREQGMIQFLRRDVNEQNDFESVIELLSDSGIDASEFLLNVFRRTFGDATGGRLLILAERVLHPMPAASEENAMVTFADLATLRRLGAPFYDLEITLYDQSSMVEIYADSARTPNLPIAFAARGTMSLPGVFAAVDLPNFLLGKADPTGITRVSDGGIGDNVPVGADCPSPNTLALVFHEGDYTPRGMADARNALAKASADFGVAMETELLDPTRSATLMRTALAAMKAGSTTMSRAISLVVNWFVAARYDINKWATLIVLAAQQTAYPGSVMIVHHGTVDTLTLNPTELELEAIDIYNEIDMQVLADNNAVTRGAWTFPHGEYVAIQ